MTYSRKLKTGIVLALREVFGATYSDDRLRNLHASIEFPVDRQEYPGIWVDFEESAVQNAGVAHYEEQEDGGIAYRWRFQGNVSYTIVAMSSLERDRIFDELVRIIAFSRASEENAAFRDFIENNDLIAMNYNFDQIEVHGNSAAPGTPWETDEMIYEKTLVMQVLGEFFVLADTGELVPLSRIVVDGRIEAPGSTEGDPVDPGHVEIPPAFDPGVPPIIVPGWH